MADPRRAKRLVWVRALWPRSARARALWVVLPVLAAVVVLTPITALAVVGLRTIEGVLAPVFASPGGRLLVLNLLLVGTAFVSIRGMRQRVAALRGALRLRQLVDGLEAVAEGRDAEAETLLARAARSRAPWPTTLPWADAHAACARARLALRRGEAGEASRLLDAVPRASLPERLQLIALHLHVEAMEQLDEVVPAERLRQIEAGLAGFPHDLSLLQARRRAEHELMEAEAAVGTQRLILEAVAPHARLSESDRLADDLARCAEQALRHGRCERARRAAEECALLRPDDAAVGLLLGDARAAHGDLRGALAAWARVGDERALRRALVEIERHPKALRPEDVLRAFPVDGGLLLVAHLEDRIGCAERAARARRLALRLRPDWADAPDLPPLALTDQPR
ncbi:MAG: hypothetical protein ACO3RU_17060 [Planctomycetota bacterium]